MILKPHYNVFTAERGGEAIAIAHEVPIDLVTVDLKMPGLSGVKALEKIKLHDPDIEAIIITGYGSMDTAVEGLRLGAFDYISKPFDVSQILDLVRRALEKRQAKLKIRELNKAEKSRVEKKEETDRLKRQLVAALAHDIKNPVGLIMGYAEYLTMRMEGRRGAKEELAFLSYILENAQNIVKLVTGFLEASKIEAGYDVARKPIQLNRLIREVGQQYIIALREKDLTLKVEVDGRLPEIMGDTVQLERVLWNLMGNAVKFTPRGGKITVLSRLEKDHVCVMVKDSGMGIHPDDLPLLFSEFRRSRSSEKIEGTGLGLFIVKTIVEAHGGKVEAESKEGKGSTFILRFPIEG